MEDSFIVFLAVIFVSYILFCVGLLIWALVT